MFNYGLLNLTTVTSFIYKHNILFIVCLVYLGPLGCCFSSVPHPLSVSLVWLKPFKSQERGMGKRCSYTSELYLN